MDKTAPPPLAPKLPHLPRLSLLVAWIVAVFLLIAWFGFWLLPAF